MSAVVVRQAALTDLEELAVLFDRYRQFQGQAGDLGAARGFLHARFDHGESVIFVAHQVSTPVGFAQLYPSFSSVSLARVFLLNDLFVLESARRTGVASKLLAAIETHAWSLGAVRITLNVANDNQPGRALYQALGWNRDRQFDMFHRYPGARGQA